MSTRWKVGSVKAGDLKRHGAVYVGRAGYGLEASPLANPFRLEAGRPRGETIERYRRHLWSRLQGDTPERREIERLANLESAILCCWCRALEEPPHEGNACHADVIVKALVWWVQTRKRSPEKRRSEAPPAGLASTEDTP